MRTTPTLRSPLRIKAADIGADGTFSGYGSVFNVVDSGGDCIRPGAFAASLKRHAESGTRAKMLWQHCHEMPIGSWVDIREDDHGLYCAGKLLLDLEKGRECYALMKAGEIDGLSIGYECQEWEHARVDDLQAKYGIGGNVSYGMPAGQVRIMHTIDLWEISPVTFPMNTVARVEHVKVRSGAQARYAGSAIDLTPIAAALDRRGALFA